MKGQDFSPSWRPSAGPIPSGPPSEDCRSRLTPLPKVHDKTKHRKRGGGDGKRLIKDCLEGTRIYCTRVGPEYNIYYRCRVLSSLRVPGYNRLWTHPGIMCSGYPGTVYSGYRCLGTIYSGGTRVQYTLGVPRKDTRRGVSG